LTDRAKNRGIPPPNTRPEIQSKAPISAVIPAELPRSVQRARGGTAGITAYLSPPL